MHLEDVTTIATDWGNMKIGIAAIALVGAFILTGCTAAPTPDEIAASSAAEHAKEVEAGVAVDIPPGYTDTGSGLAYEWSNTVADCSYYKKCAEVDVFAYEDCPSSVYLEANLIDVSGVAIGYTNGTLSGLTMGQRGKVLLGTMNTDASKFQLTKANCY